MNSNHTNLNQSSMGKIDLSKKVTEVWENHMKTFCSGRESAFHLSSELIFASSTSDTLNILDIACGYGGWSKFLENEAENQNINIKFVGMEQSEHRLQVYQDILASSVTTIKGDILNTLPKLNKAFFDSALLGWASHEIPQAQLETIYSLIRETLKPQGLLLIADFVSVSITEIDSLSKKLIQKRRESLIKDPIKMEEENWVKSLDRHEHHNHNHSQHHRHKQHYSVKEHLSFLNKAGFSVTEEIWKNMNSSMLLAIR